MLKDTASRFAAHALEALMSGLAALRELAWRNRRMTAQGLAAAIVFLAAKFGLEISAEAQATLATGLFVYLGIAGRDKQRSLRG